MADAGSSEPPPSPGAAPKVVKQIKRLDGTIEEVHVGLPPKNPNFCPRKTVYEHKVVTNDKLEVLLKFYERKGKPLTPELLAKKAELEASGVSTTSGVGNISKQSAKKQKGKGGKAKSAVAEAAPAPAAPEPIVVPKAAPEVSAWYKNRPKGGVKVLGGTEGALTGAKRPAEDAGL